MLPTPTLRAISQARLQDAEMLLVNTRFDGAGYICGYAVELALKARICDTLNWSGYPESKKEFENLLSFKTHNLDVLLALSGKEQQLKKSHFADWSIICAWNPEARYRAVGMVSQADAEAFLGSTKTLLPLT